MWINNFPRLVALMMLGLVASGSVHAGEDAGENAGLDEARRAELEASLDEARAQLDEAAARLGELNGELYSMETLGSHGKKPMLGVLLGDRTSSGGLEVVGITPGRGAEEAGLEHDAAALTLFGNFDWVPAASTVIPNATNGTIQAIAEPLFTDWVLAFEATALLLTIAAAGAIALAHYKRRLT